MQQRRIRPLLDWTLLIGGSGTAIRVKDGDLTSHRAEAELQLTTSHQYTQTKQDHGTRHDLMRITGQHPPSRKSNWKGIRTVDLSQEEQNWPVSRDYWDTLTPTFLRRILYCSIDILPRSLLFFHVLPAGETQLYLETYLPIVKTD